MSCTSTILAPAGGTNAFSSTLLVNVVSSTPTLLVGNRLYQGRLDSDAIRRLVDSLAPLASR